MAARILVVDDEPDISALVAFHLACRSIWTGEADQALVGEYAVISQLLKNQVQKGEIDSFQWTDKNGNSTPDNGDTFTVLASGK